MSKELELFGLDGLGGWFRRTKGHKFVPAPGQKCLNCDADLNGRFCYDCGQDADTHHRTIGHLIFEAFEGLFHLDGRLWQTLPPLFLAPGKLARDFMEGRVARHVPPFRIFLIALLVFMFVAEHKTEEARHHPHAASGEVRQSMIDLGFDDSRKPAASDTAVVSKPNATGGKDVTVTRHIDLFAMSEDDSKYLAGIVKTSHIKPLWLKDDIYKALSNPERFFTAVFTWGHRLALLLLPIIGLSLGFLYMGKKNRRFYLYDHLLVSMNLLSFMFFTNAVEFMLPDAVRVYSRGLLLLWTLVIFFMTLRGAYGSSIIGAIFKSIVLWIMTSIAFGVVLTGVMFVSLTAI